MHMKFPDIPLPHMIINLHKKQRSYRLAKNLDDETIEAEFYFKADVDELFAKMSEEINGLNEYIARLKHDNNVPHM